MEKRTDNTVLSNGVLLNELFYPKKNLPSGTLRIVLTTKCNYQCKYCFAEGEIDKEIRELDIDKLKKILVVAKEFGITNIKLTGGEPLLYPKIKELLKFIRELDIPYIDLTTNISMLNSNNIDLLNKYNVNAITLSLNTLDKEKFVYLSNFSNADIVYDNLNKVINSFNGKLRVNCIVFDDKYYREDYDEIIELCKNNNLGLRIVEPSIVEGLSITYTKEKFKEYVEYLKEKADKIIKSDCESVEYIFFEDWYLTIMHSLCDNKLCNSCKDYMYIRITSELKLKPCLARRDTEVEVNFDSNKEIEKAFIEAINYM
jgi:cyclic pyranopterin phosphate synthase